MIELLDRAGQLARERVPFVLATVVNARHPTSVRRGDRALVLSDGTIEGFVGGVCAESSVRLHALRALETGEPLLLVLVPGDAVDAGAPPEGAVVEHNPCLSGGALEIFLEPQPPTPRLVVVGTSPIARALERLASAAGYEVAAGEGRPQPGDAAVIVASHGAGEERVLEEALSSGVPYVALVASPKRGAAVRAALEVPEELRAQLHTPAGLNIGARTPTEIAISILAELVAEHHAPPAVAAVMHATDPECGMEVAVTARTPWLDTPEGRAYFCGERCRDAYAERYAAR